MVSKEVMGREGCTCFNGNIQYTLVQVAHFEGYSICMTKGIPERTRTPYLVCGPNKGCHAEGCSTARPFIDEEEAQEAYTYRRQQLLSMEVSDVLS